MNRISSYVGKAGILALLGYEVVHDWIESATKNKYENDKYEAMRVAMQQKKEDEEKENALITILAALFLILIFICYILRKMKKQIIPVRL